MLKPLTRSLTSAMLAALALGATGCGRIFVPAPPPAPAPVAMHAGVPADAPAAVALARMSVSQADAPVTFVAAYGVLPSGKMADSFMGGWVVGFVEGKDGATKATLVTLDWTGRARARAAKPPAGPLPTPLMVDKLPPMRQALGWARDAGLPRAQSYQVAYVAAVGGPVVGVAERVAMGADPLATTDDADQPTEAGKAVLLDASTGRPLAPLKTAEPPAETPAEPAPPADSPESATALVALATSLRRGF